MSPLFSLLVTVINATNPYSGVSSFWNSQVGMETEIAIITLIVVGALWMLRFYLQGFRRDMRGWVLQRRGDRWIVIAKRMIPVHGAKVKWKGYGYTVDANASILNDMGKDILLWEYRHSEPITDLSRRGIDLTKLHDAKITNDYIYSNTVGQMVNAVKRAENVLDKNALIFLALGIALGVAVGVAVGFSGVIPGLGPHITVATNSTGTVHTTTTYPLTR